MWGTPDQKCVADDKQFDFTATVPNPMQTLLALYLKLGINYKFPSFYVPLPFKCWSMQGTSIVVWICILTNTIFLIFLLLGAYRFLYKQRKCSIVLLQAFYTTAIICIVCRVMMYSLTINEFDDLRIFVDNKNQKEPAINYTNPNYIQNYMWKYYVSPLANEVIINKNSTAIAYAETRLNKFEWIQLFWFVGNYFSVLVGLVQVATIAELAYYVEVVNKEALKESREKRLSDLQIKGKGCWNSLGPEKQLKVIFIGILLYALLTICFLTVTIVEFFKRWSAIKHSQQFLEDGDNIHGWLKLISDSFVSTTDKYQCSLVVLLCVMLVAVFWKFNKNMKLYFPNSMIKEKKQFQRLFLTLIINYLVVSLYYLTHSFWDNSICCVEVSWNIRGLCNLIFDFVPIGTVLWLHHTSNNGAIQQKKESEMRESLIMDSKKSFVSSFIISADNPRAMKDLDMCYEESSEDQLTILSPNGSSAPGFNMSLDSPRTSINSSIQNDSIKLPEDDKTDSTHPYHASNQSHGSSFKSRGGIFDNLLQTCKERQIEDQKEKTKKNNRVENSMKHLLNNSELEPPNNEES